MLDEQDDDDVPTDVVCSPSPSPAARLGGAGRHFHDVVRGHGRRLFAAICCFKPNIPNYTVAEIVSRARILSDHYHGSSVVGG
jgi:hypothetical protein